MTDIQTVIDLEFGTAQLSGNKSLLFSLLHKFAEEYKDTEGQLNHMFEHNEWESARILLHTLKGVTGNLGISALHQHCKGVEEHLKSNNSIPSCYPEFLSILRETLSTVDKLNCESADEKSASEAAPSSINQDKDDFLRALRNSEFISQSQLSKWVEATTNDITTQKAIKEAVDELDYQTAIELINA